MGKFHVKWILFVVMLLIAGAVAFIASYVLQVDFAVCMALIVAAMCLEQICEEEACLIVNKWS